MQNVYLAIVLAPLAGSLIAGLFGKAIGRSLSHWVTTVGVAVSCLLSIVVFKHQAIDGAAAFNGSVYTWMVSGGVTFEVGFLIDKLSALMMVVVTFVSLMVHIYTIGYMRDDPGYQRFFSYISLFTFSMLMLVMANNFMQLFFGWEAVGLLSYLLIGFWYTRESAIYASLKAFLVNRVGDFGFLLGIAAILMYFNTLDYSTVFSTVSEHKDLTIEILPGLSWSVITVICILLFIGAVGKSAQVPLHVWLPDSMEGPTPISALIHAATMVTAGVYMVARMSPLFEFSNTALSVVMVIGGTTALFMGFLGVIQSDIKRVIAYSTLSQLGYMMAALGASAYAAGIFHLMTHAFFKALLFLCAGSVIMAMHHDQDMRNMGGLRKYMPITWLTFLVGSLALIGAPGFAGFFSKDTIIEAIGLSTLPGAGYAYFAATASVFVTALYTFRMYFLVFHGKERMGEHVRSQLRESPAVVTIPLIMLAIPSAIIGYIYVGPMAFGDFFGKAIVVLHQHDVLGELARDFHGPAAMMLHSVQTLPFWLAASGVFVAWFLYLKRPDIPGVIKERLSWLYFIMERKYGFDDFNAFFFAKGTRGIGRLLWKFGDVRVIDGLVVNGSARSVVWFSGVLRRVQSGYLYHYAFAMIIGLLLLIGIFALNGLHWA